MKPLVVIPLYVVEEHDVEVALDAVRSVRKTVSDSVDILVVDDHSPDRALVDGIEKALDRLGAELFRKDENSGFSKTVNVGLRRALSEGRDALLLNADVEITTPGWVKLCQKVKDDHDRDAAVIGALLLYPTGTIQHAGIYFSLLTRTFDHMYKYGPGNLREAHQARVCPVTGAFQYIRHETLEKVGIYDENFHMAHEDVDYCVSGDTVVLTDMGWKTACSLEGKRVNVVAADGIARSARWFKARGGKQPLWRVELEDGTVLYATREHRWPVAHRGGVKWLTTQEIAGERLLRVNPHVVIDSGSQDFRTGVQNGFTVGDGTVNTGRPSAKVVAYKTNPTDQAFARKWFDRISTHANGNMVALGLHSDFKKRPVGEVSRDYLAGFAAGLIAADAAYADRSIRLIMADGELLQWLRDELVSMGLSLSAVDEIPYSKGSARSPRKMFRLFIGADVVRANPWLWLRTPLAENGAFTKRPTIGVSSVVPSHRTEEVFCCEEPVTNSWVTRGNILTGNCVRVFQAGLQCVYEPRVRAFHFEAMFRGRPSKKIQDWQTKSWIYFVEKHANQSFAGMVPFV